MKKIIKTVAAISAAAMLAAMFAGCGGKEASQNSTDGNSFTLWAVMDSTSGVSLTSYSDMLMFQEMENRTGVKIDFIHPIAGSTGSEAFVTMLSSDKRPDIMEYNWSSYTGGPQQALDDEVIICLNDYMEKYAPNYYDYMEGEKGKANDYLYKLQATTEDGRYYGFNNLSIGTTRTFSGIFIRKDKLDEWGMNVPQTIDEWTAVLARAKSAGFAKPFTCTNDAMGAVYATPGFHNAFGVGASLYREGDDIVFGPAQKGYKQYLAQMAQWGKAGYIDSGFITNDMAKVEGNIVNDISVAGYGYISTLGKLTTAGKTNNPSFELVACPLPVANKGDVAEFSNVADEASPLAYGISATCGNYEKAIEWCDYLYSDDGCVLKSFGVEGDTFTIEEADGEKHYVYTEKITNPESSGVTSVSDALYKYMLPANHPGLNQHPDYLNGYYPLESQQIALEMWNKDTIEARKHSLPGITLTDDEAKEVGDIIEIAKTDLEVAMCDIILGRKAVDAFDAAIKTAMDNGYTRLVEIYQASYDRYTARLNK